MQFKLPLFPGDTNLINNSVEFRKQDDFVYYLHSGSPIYFPKEDDKSGYRHTLASLVVNNLCTIGELSSALGINRKNIERYSKSLRDNGPYYFFNRLDGRGQCHKMTDDMLSVVQSGLDAGKSQYRIAVITYRKNVKDTWDESLFEKQDVETGIGTVKMELCEQVSAIDNCTFREVRKLSEDKHQTAIITNNKIISLALVAAYMFGRWVQENFFRYMRQEYALDKIR